MVRRHIADDLKETALSMSRQGLSDSEVRDLTGISERSLHRLRSTYRDTGAVSRKAMLPGRPRILTAMEVKFLCDCVDRRPDMTLAELQTELREVCAVEISLQTIARSLQRRGYSTKRVTRPVPKRDEQDREEFKTLIKTYFRPEQLVFADESYFNPLTLRRPYAWSKPGEPATQNDRGTQPGTKYYMLPAISLDGIRHLEVLENAITGDDFRRFVQGLLLRMNKWPLPHSVLVVDNASIHKVAGIREMVEERGVRLLYLPEHSPDLNPMGLAFSSIKAWLRAHRDHVKEALESENGVVYDAFWEAVYSVTSDDAKEWYMHCGYSMLD